MIFSSSYLGSWTCSRRGRAAGAAPAAGSSRLSAGSGTAAVEVDMDGRDLDPCDIGGNLCRTRPVAVRPIRRLPG